MTERAGTVAVASVSTRQLSKTAATLYPVFRRPEKVRKNSKVVCNRITRIGLRKNSRSHLANNTNTDQADQDRTLRDFLFCHDQ